MRISIGDKVYREDGYVLGTVVETDARLNAFRSGVRISTAQTGVLVYIDFSELDCVFGCAVHNKRCYGPHDFNWPVEVDKKIREVEARITRTQGWLAVVVVVALAYGWFKY